MTQDRSWRTGTRLLSLCFAGTFLLVALRSYGGAKTEITSNLLVARHDDLNSALDAFPASNITLHRREDYSCSASKPCSNGACCGESGFCGYGPTYCGDGCINQCDATAECGQYAAEPGTKCPLNVCCSQYGFCGTTELFCDSKCQSNCDEHPSPPGGGSGQVFDRVIGYYESWSNSKSCHKVTPSDLPLDALTHVNYAFAYIDPGSYEVVTMDSATPGSLFDDTTVLKTINPGLEVWVSIGGWTFSDNGTATQPTFGEIAADAGKRQTFANNLVHFMQQHGFDGVDLDWEYPGAPDRGGKKEDTANYVKLLETLRTTFDKSGGKYGITFTAPSSYWYLRWFDLPGLLKYSNWINVMTYDLHGVWDSQNPIGSIVQGHTNLTEIKLALELFWRNDIPASKVALGWGFYGRSFTLSSASCSAPGCPFSGASNPGPCTGTGGYLGFYEIQEVLKSGAKAVHDTEAAVNYLVFDNDQWISYDDKVTFKQKADWANSVGIGGSLIWASDLDDDQYSAHSALLGRTVKPNNQVKALADSQGFGLTESIKASTGEDCYTYDGKCQDLNDPKALAAACGDGKVVVGWDDAGCGKKNHHYGKPVCCPSRGAPNTCKWRGDDTSSGGPKSDCSGRCEAGEINVGGIKSSWGGGFTNDGNTNKCGRGYKTFCCVSPDYEDATKGCYMSSCGGDCKSSDVELFRVNTDCSQIYSRAYCCPDPNPFSDCHWVGSAPDCAIDQCAEDEIELALNEYGVSNWNSAGCWWGRQKTACCKIGRIQTEPATCSTDACTDGLSCPPDDDDAEDDSDESSLSRRDDFDFDDDPEYLEKRYFAEGPDITVTAPPYPGPVRLYTTFRYREAIPIAFQVIKGYCIGPALRLLKVAIPNPVQIVRGLKMETEHILDRQTIANSFIPAMFNGELPSGHTPGIVAVAQGFFDRWNVHIAALGAYAAIGGPSGPKPDTINDRVMHCLGSTFFRRPFSLLEKQVNIAKGNLFAFKNPVGLDAIKKAAKLAASVDTKAAVDKTLSLIRVGYAVFEYINDQNSVSAYTIVNTQMRLQLGYIEQVTGVTTLVDWWDAWFADFGSEIGRKGQTWATQALNLVEQIVVDANQDRANQGLRPMAVTQSIMAGLDDFRARIPELVFPVLNQIPTLGPP